MSKELQTSKFQGRPKGGKPHVIKAKKFLFKRHPELRLLKVGAIAISACYKGDHEADLEDGDRLPNDCLLDATEAFLNLNLEDYDRSDPRRTRYGPTGAKRRREGKAPCLAFIMGHWVDNVYYEQPTIGKDGRRALQKHHPIETHRDLYEAVKKEYLKKNTRSAAGRRKRIKPADPLLILEWLKLA